MEEELYKENILDHYHNPRHYGALVDFDLKGKKRNTTCGDELTLYLKLNDNGVIADVGFEGEGCALSRAAASLLVEKISGANIGDVRLLTPGDVYTLLGWKVGPSRSACVLLGYGALERILKEKYGNA
ncbi:hypothetical protein AUJ44_03875 [Candidatus Nomurabacteria bacterium CG1_02_47_685]|nr:MAG: hypothetical protein AUJ44_03875 [Candidatus Nomurabacteria bacterium CG1_02_47_685]